MSTRYLLAFVLAACSSHTAPPGSEGSGDPVGEAINEGHASGATVAAQAFGELSADDDDTMIGKTAGILAALDDGEVNEANFAVQVVAGADILQFANDMITDHENANAQLDGIVRSYGVTYLQSNASASLDSESARDLAELRDASDVIDFTYMQHQVKDHAAAQDVLDQLADLVGPGAMGDYIANARAMVDDHLDSATELFDTLY